MIQGTQTALLPAEEVPVLGEYDVVVCGGGPAGVGAAAAAAREGARTLLVERFAFLGGTGTAAVVGTWVDTPGGPLFDELEQRMDALGHANRRFSPNGHIHPKGRVTFHTETLKAVMLRMVREAGADVLFNTLVIGAWRPEDAVEGVVLANRSGRALVRAKAAVDATADADVVAFAGAEFMKGDPEDGRIQHVNFRWLSEGAPENKTADEALVARMREAVANGELHPPDGVFRPQAETFPYHGPEGILSLGAWEIEKVDPSDPLAVSRTLVQGQLAALELVELMRAHAPGWEGLRIGRFPAQLGTRESRRVLGRYVVTREDVLAGRKFEDGVAECCFFIDFHDSPPGTTIPYTLEYKRSNTPPEGEVYEIPYRALLPKDRPGLLVAGRCVSGDRSAQASFRGMPTCMYTGHAAGLGAALAAADGVAPHEVDAKRIREKTIGESA